MESMFFTLREMSEFLNVSQKTIHRLRDAGKIPQTSSPIASKLMWRKDDIQDWVNANMPDCRKSGWKPSRFTKGGAR